MARMCNTFALVRYFSIFPILSFQVVEYFDQQTGALHTICWSKSTKVFFDATESFLLTGLHQMAE